jgi:hypothetical protein
MARIEKYEADKRFEAKYHMPFKVFQAKVEGLQNGEVFTEDERRFNKSVDFEGVRPGM